MPIGYAVTQAGLGYRAPQFWRLDPAVDGFMEKLTRYPKPYQVRKPDEGWGPDRSAAEVRARVTKAMDGPAGSKVYARSSDPQAPEFVMRKVMQTLGPEVVQAAMSQLGVDYRWAWADPRGDADGVSGFDCSGLTSWCYAQVDVALPHSADQQMHTVHTFEDRAALQRGDLVFYHVGRLGTGVADHVGIYAGTRTGIRMVVDASSYFDAVVYRAMDANPVLRFGYVTAVTGEH